jgi:hypothetical protein
MSVHDTHPGVSLREDARPLGGSASLRWLG